MGPFNNHVILKHWDFCSYTICATEHSEHFEYCWILAHYFWIIFLGLENFQSEKMNEKLEQSEQNEEKGRKEEKKLIFQNTFLRYYFLQGSSVSMFLKHKCSFLEAFCLAYMLYGSNNQKLEAYSKTCFVETGTQLAPVL